MRVVVVVLLACATPQRATTMQRTYVHHRYYVNFVPFGAGQFQNDEPDKGIGFAVCEGITAATSIAIWTYLTAHYGDRMVPAGDATTVRRLEEVEIATAITWFALVGWGIGDALVHYQPYVRVDDGSAAVGLAWHR